MGVAGRLFSGGFGKLGAVPPVRPECTTVELGRVSLACLEWGGRGRPLVMLHGLQNTAWAWARVAQLLSDRRRVIVPSQRGHGRSSAPESGYSLEETSDDLEALLGRLGIAQVDLAGHSWGGKGAFHFAATRPHMVATLTLADPVPPAGLNRIVLSFPSLVAAAYAPERRGFADEACWRAGAREILYLKTMDDVDLRLWRDKFKVLDNGAYEPRLPAGAFAEIMDRTLSTDISALSGGIECPSLLIRPTFSVSFLPGELRAMRREMRQLDEVRVSGDHTFVHSNPLDTARFIGAFLDMHP